MTTHLAQTRSNGLLSMVKQMKHFALAYKIKNRFITKDYENEEELKEKVIEYLQTIFDPEIPVNIYEMGLIYEVNILPINNVQIVMTLTAPELSGGAVLTGGSGSETQGNRRRQ